MMYKKHQIPYASRFKFALNDVGRFSPPKHSMFHNLDYLNKDEDDENDNEGDENGSTTNPQKQPPPTVSQEAVPSEVNILQKQKEAEELLAKQKAEAHQQFLNQYGIVIDEEAEKRKREEANQVRTMTKQSGRIQFQNVIIPPNAPIDLYCEECETSFASLYCSACKQIFCYPCADICHPKIAAYKLMHEHEANGHIRGLIPGDKSRVKKENQFYLPDYEVYPEEIAKIKDLTKPNTLVTSELTLNPAKQLTANHPLYKVNDLIIFKDPLSTQRAYGRVISEYDYRHGTAATPAIIRGEDSNIYYTVMIIDLLVHADDLENLLLNDQNYLEEKRLKEKEIDTLHHLIPELPYDTMRHARLILVKLDQKIQELNNLLTLGPKFHLRDLNFPKGIPFKMPNRIHRRFDEDMNEIITYDEEGLEGSDEEGNNGGDDQSLTDEESRDEGTGKRRKPKPSNWQKKLMDKQQLSKNNIRKFINQLNRDENISLGEESSSSSSSNAPKPQHFHRHSPSKLNVNQKVFYYNAQENRKKLLKNISDNTDLTAISDLTTDNPDLPVDKTMEIIQDNMHRRDRMIEKDAVILHPSATGVPDPKNPGMKKDVDFNLYANIDKLEDDSVLSYHNDHQRPVLAMHRSYQDYVIQATVDAYKSSHYYPNQHPAKFPLEKEIQQKLLSVVVLAEKDIQCSFVDHLKELQMKKESLMKGMFSKTELIYLRAQMKLKFIHWKKFLHYSRKAVYIIAARKIQSIARMWLCRNKLEELRWYYDELEEKKRQLLHQKFGYCQPTDRYAVTYNSKVFFRTHADLNRYVYFLRVTMGKIIRFLTMKKLNFYQESLRRWKSVIYEFVERDLVNTHIHLDLVKLDQQQAGGLRTIDEIKEGLIQDNEKKLTEFLINNIESNMNHRKLKSIGDIADNNATGKEGIQQLKEKEQEKSQYIESLPIYNEFSYDNIASLPLQIQYDENGSAFMDPNVKLVKDYAEYSKKHHKGKRNSIDEEQLLAENTVSNVFHRADLEEKTQKTDDLPDETDLILQELDKLGTLPGYNPSQNIPLPTLPVFTHPKSFKDRLYFDIAQQPMTTHHPISIPHNVYFNPLLANQSQGEYLLYRNQLEGPTSQSYWLIPGILMIGNAPFGPAIRKTFDQIPPVFFENYFKNLNSIGSPPRTPGGSRLNANAKWSVKNTDLTAIAALLLSGVDTFISILSEAEELMLETFYQSQPVEIILRESLEQTKILSNKIIAENLVLIKKQENQLSNIPNFGKSDPRYAQAYQEKLRCQGRITLYQNTINTIKNQIKLLPKEIHFYRLTSMNPVSSESIRTQELNKSNAQCDLLSLIPWNTQKVLSSVWFIEELIRKEHTIYLYSGSFTHLKDEGPTRDGLSGTLGSIVMGRMYHMKGIDAIFQWQKSHDFMKILQLTTNHLQSNQYATEQINPFIPEDAQKLSTTPTKSSIQSGGDENNQASSAGPRKKPIWEERTSTRNKDTQDNNGSSANNNNNKDILPLSKSNPSLAALKDHATHLLYRTACPPAPWQKALIIDMLDKSHEWINYPITRSQLTPEIYTVLERNNYDISLRNKNAYPNHELTDFYTSQKLLPTSQNNLPHYFNQNSKNPYEEKQLAIQQQKQQQLNQKKLSSSASSPSLKSAGSLMFSSSSKKFSEKSMRSHNTGITIRGDPVIKEEDEEEAGTTSDSFPSLTMSSSLPSLHSTSSIAITSSQRRNNNNPLFQSIIDENNPFAAKLSGNSRPSSATITEGGGGGGSRQTSRPRLTVLQKMKLQVAEEEQEAELKKQREKEEQNALYSQEFDEAQRQEKILLLSSVHRLKQSHYQSPPPKLG